MGKGFICADSGSKSEFTRDLGNCCDDGRNARNASRLVQIQGLTVAFDGVEAVHEVSLDIHKGEIVGVVGESGSGKSVTALTLMGLCPQKAEITGGCIRFDDVTLIEAGKPQNKALYARYKGNRMSMIFQEPMTSLNPTMRVGRQVAEMGRLHTDQTMGVIRDNVLKTFEAVGLKEPEKIYDSYPHQLSGGQRQRVMIAMAILLEPELLIADEPTTALDVTIQNQIVALLKEINRTHHMAVLFITHDLNLAKRICGRIVVMKDGKVVESGEAQEIFAHPQQAYTRMLINAMPSRIRRRRKSAQDGAKEASAVQVRPAASAEKVIHTPILEVQDLNVYYRENANSLFGRGKKKQVIKHITFAVKKGEILGLVGESGCGKTSLSKAVLGINQNITGSIVHYSQRPQMIFQDPYSSLNPSKSIGWLLQEPLRAAGRQDAALAMTKADRQAAAHDMLKKVGLAERYFDYKPSQLSGGQRQRVSIAQALITHPQLVIADEPVSALDVTIQAQIMELMLCLQEEMNLAYLFISHDINVVYQMSDRIMVMKDGVIIEEGDTEAVFQSPKAAYTKLLLA